MPHLRYPTASWSHRRTVVSLLRESMSSQFRQWFNLVHGPGPMSASPVAARRFLRRLGIVDSSVGCKVGVPTPRGHMDAVPYVILAPRPPDCGKSLSWLWVHHTPTHSARCDSAWPTNDWRIGLTVPTTRAHVSKVALATPRGNSGVQSSPLRR